MSAALDYYSTGGTDYGYTGEDSAPVLLAGDVRDNAQMSPFMPPVAQAQGMSWWESIAAYGLTRAIDNRFAPTQALGNVYPGSLAGQNGYTYQQGRTAPGIQQGSGGVFGIPTWVLLVAGGLLAYRAIAD